MNDLFFMDCSDKYPKALLSALTRYDNHYQKGYERSGPNSGYKIFYFIKSTDEIISFINLICKKI